MDTCSGRWPWSLLSQGLESSQSRPRYCSICCNAAMEMFAIEPRWCRGVCVRTMHERGWALFRESFADRCRCVPACKRASSFLQTFRLLTPRHASPQQHPLRVHCVADMYSTDEYTASCHLVIQHRVVHVCIPVCMYVYSLLLRP